MEALEWLERIVPVRDYEKNDSKPAADKILQKRWRRYEEGNFLW